MPSRMFEGASIGTISGGTFVNHADRSVLDKLSAAAAHSALHDAPARTDASRCHQHTRVEVLENLERWAQGICAEGTPIVWLHGGAGAGKSSVMQTLAERFAAQQLALGSFFFSRSDSTRNTAECLIPTLAYQLAQLFPSALDLFKLVLDRDPLILKKSLRAQLPSLLVQPLQHLIKLGSISIAPQSLRLFLIDGLDECNDPVQQQAIIQAVAVVCHEHHIPVKFLISSRPEFAISTSFRWFKRENRVLGAISLSEDPDAEADIRRFVEDEFLKIRLRHPFDQMIPPGWPDIYDINRLIWKSSSHFIYASTAMNYIWTAKDNPVRSLQVVLGLEISRTISPFAELDVLYHHIIGSAAHQDQVRQVLAHCVFSRLSLEVDVFCVLLECSVEDLSIFLADMGPLVRVSKSNRYDEVELLHQSLGDFLCDKARSQLLHISQEAYFTSTLKHCFRLLNLVRQNEYTTPGWPATDRKSGLDYLYKVLKTQIFEAVDRTLKVVETQELLKLYTLRNFHECQLALSLQYYQPVRDGVHEFGIPEFYNIYRKDEWLSVYGVSDDLVQYLRHMISTKIEDGGSLSQSALVDFFDILELHLGFESKPVAAVIIPLLFSGYSVVHLRDILSHCCFTHATNPFCNTASGRIDSFKEGVPLYDSAMSSLLVSRCIPLFPLLFCNDMEVTKRITSSGLASIRQSGKASAIGLRDAADAILNYLPSLQPWHTLSTGGATRLTPHKTWLRRKKPSKHVSTGSPKLASRFHTYCLDTYNYRLTTDYRKNQRKCSHYLERLGLPVATFVPDWEMRMQHDRLYIELMYALIWLLPKASYSERIVLHSRKNFPPKVYNRNPRLCRRVRKFLGRYSTRVQNEKLQALSQRIDEGDVDALIEKSQMLHLNAQD